MKNTDFFYCYNKNLFKYLHDVKGIDYITVAKHPTTNKIYSMFFKDEQLQQALNEYKALNHEK